MTRLPLLFLTWVSFFINVLVCQFSFSRAFAPATTMYRNFALQCCQQTQRRCSYFSTIYPAMPRLALLCCPTTLSFGWRYRNTKICVTVIIVSSSFATRCMLQINAYCRSLLSKHRAFLTVLIEHFFPGFLKHKHICICIIYLRPEANGH